MKFVDVQKINSKMTFDIVYATKENFLGFSVYTSPKCFLHQDAASALLKVQKEAESIGLSLKVYDGYRPLSVQKIMWDHVQDERYVSNPAVNKGRHTRGTAVDVTLVDREGNELLMPTPFDDFTEKAHADSPCSPEAYKNRALLKKLMGNQGFIMLPTEWWHFDLQGWDNDDKYPSLNLTFEELSTFALGTI
jgi:D-alanyl-D-alanine dipeptidase